MVAALTEDHTGPRYNRAYEQGGESERTLRDLPKMRRPGGRSHAAGLVGTEGLLYLSTHLRRPVK